MVGDPTFSSHMINSVSGTYHSFHKLAFEIESDANPNSMDVLCIDGAYSLGRC